MKKLLKMFRSLPPEMRMMLAMAGMGSPIGAIYLLRRFLFPGVKTIYLIFGVAAVIAVIALFGFLFSRVFGARGRKRQKKMEADMAGGPDPLSQHDCGVAETGAGVHHLLARIDLELGEDRGAVQAEAADQDVLVLDELRHQDLVPELDEFRRRRDDGLGHGTGVSVERKGGFAGA